MSTDIQVKKKKSVITIKPTGELTINSAQKFKTCLIENLSDFTELEIDLSEIKKIDTAGFQILVLARKEVEREDKIFRILNPAAGVERIFNLYEEQL